MVPFLSLLGKKGVGMGILQPDTTAVLLSHTWHLLPRGVQRFDLMRRQLRQERDARFQKSVQQQAHIVSHPCVLLCTSLPVQPCAGAAKAATELQKGACGQGSKTVLDLALSSFGVLEIFSSSKMRHYEG